jgi:hypothetical protein
MMHMEQQDVSGSRVRIERIAGSLTEMLHDVPEGRTRRQLAECAARLSSLARTIPAPGAVPLSERGPVLVAARLASAPLNNLQRSSIILFGILLAEPGVLQPTRLLATAMGVSHQSVRVFAFYLRKWLGEVGHGDALGSQWGMGYRIDPAHVAPLLSAFPSLDRLVESISGEDARELRQAA